MGRGVWLLAKILGGIVAVVVVLLTGAVVAFHNSAVQQRLTRYATRLLQERLQTEVSVDSLSVSLFGEDVRLHRLLVKDLQGRDMLQMEQLGVDLDLWALLHRHVKVTEARLTGVSAQLYMPATDSDSVANYQFVIEAFKRKKREEQPADTMAADTMPRRQPFTVDVSRVTLERIHLIYNSQQAELGRLTYEKGTPGEGALVSIGELCYRTDNHKPRKNAGKPKRGFFDAGHIDAVANMDFRLEHVGKDSIVAVLTSGNIVDKTAGINITDLRFRAVTDMQQVRLSDVALQLPNTRLSIPSADITLPSKKKGRRLAYSTSLIKGRVGLKDIARPFAPVLRNFSIPLNLQTRMQGDDNGMRFSDVRVSTDNNTLTVAATGRINDLRGKHKLNIHFDVSRMTTTAVEAERIINQFAVKKFMMKQLHALGRIHYSGHFDVLWKRELFAGRLQTSGGPVDFHFALDELSKYVFGTARTSGLDLGYVMDMPDIGNVVCTANFRFDISKPRTAKMRRVKGGKLPIGHVDAQVAEAQYKRIKVRNIVADINSDGAVAEGSLAMRGKRVDVLCDFSFTNTSDMKKTKIKPGIKFHGLSDDDKAAKAAEKADRKAAKAAEKAARKAARAAEKEAKAAEKAARKAARSAEKEAKAAEPEVVEGYTHSSFLPFCSSV